MPSRSQRLGELSVQGLPWSPGRPRFRLVTEYYPSLTLAATSLPSRVQLAVVEMRDPGFSPPDRAPERASRAVRRTLYRSPVLPLVGGLVLAPGTIGELGRIVGADLYDALDRVVDKMNKIREAYFTTSPQEVFDKLLNEELNEHE